MLLTASDGSPAFGSYSTVIKYFSKAICLTELELFAIFVGFSLKQDGGGNAAVYADSFLPSR
jgi:hypothetical protein